MTGRKFSKEKKRHRSRLSGPEEGGGSERKRRSTEATRGLPEETKCIAQVPEKKDVVEEPSDIEEGGLDLTIQLKPVSFYITDKKEMLQQCFYIIGEKKLQKMLPDVLKNCSIEEIKRLCLEQLDLMSEKKLLKILEGESGADSDSDEETNDAEEKTIVEPASQQDNSIDSTSSLKEENKLEGLDSKQENWQYGSPVYPIQSYISQGKGEDSDILSINADAYDSDIEGPCNEEDNPDVPERTVGSGDGQIDDLQKDIEKSVNEILGLAESSPKDPKAAALAVPPTDDVQPSAQQLELLELEMRARAIKALMKAGDVKK
ncbi:PREDICTED: caspase activity and apoptosis inhibitor 1 isoform X1 [Thamnophis sirtalis]|uniref:Caspase activity and apoptosis inhibitor 1 isoform X1 n=1 Tax=Thamnophis sirtalis TaxID=35019 RepID=A0A6I9Y1B1_9SAUR|nr:PREDICTED: caspase activity and apoptosis inhibitor 1 isoform X1 [Thamnophis sirtalis]